MTFLNNSDRKLGENICSNNRRGNIYIVPEKTFQKTKSRTYSSKYGCIISQPLYMVECKNKIELI